MRINAVHGCAAFSKRKGRDEAYAADAAHASMHLHSSSCLHALAFKQLHDNVNQ